MGPYFQRMDLVWPRAKAGDLKGASDLATSAALMLYRLAQERLRIARAGAALRGREKSLDKHTEVGGKWVPTPGEVKAGEADAIKKFNTLSDKQLLEFHESYTKKAPTRDGFVNYVSKAEAGKKTENPEWFKQNRRVAMLEGKANAYLKRAGSKDQSEKDRKFLTVMAAVFRNKAVRVAVKRDKVV